MAAEEEVEKVEEEEEESGCWALRYVSTVTKSDKSTLSEFTLDSGLCGSCEGKKKKKKSGNLLKRGKRAFELGHAAVNSILAFGASGCFGGIC